MEILERLVEALGPELGLLLGLGEGGRDAPPALLDRLVERRAVRPFEPVFHVPDLLRDRGDARHNGFSPDGTTQVRWIVVRSLTARAGAHQGGMFPVCFNRPIPVIAAYNR